MTAWNLSIISVDSDTIRCLLHAAGVLRPLSQRGCDIIRSPIHLGRWPLREAGTRQPAERPRAAPGARSSFLLATQLTSLCWKPLSQLAGPELDRNDLNVAQYCRKHAQYVSPSLLDCLETGMGYSCR